MKKALDLFCGGGGAAEGLVRAGYEVLGFDQRTPRDYPGRFQQIDLTDPDSVSTVRRAVEAADLVWASPPCQHWAGPPANRPRNPNLLPLTRRLIRYHPKSVVENVPAAPLRHDLRLLGCMVGLPAILRRRAFELHPAPLFRPEEPPWDDAYRRWLAADGITVTKSLSSPSHYYRREAQGRPGRVPVAEARTKMDVTQNLTGHEIGEAVPPPYVLAALAALEQGAHHAQ